MSQVVSFEVDTFQNERWVLECVVDDKNMALSTAKRLYDSQRYSAVRVVQETYDENSNSSRERVIFETTVANKENRAAKRMQASSAPPKVNRSERAPLKKRPKQTNEENAEKKSGPNIWVLLFLLCTILGVGVTGLFYLNNI